MQVQLFLNTFQMDLVVECGKLEIIFRNFALLTFDSKKEMTQTCKDT